MKKNIYRQTAFTPLDISGTGVNLYSRHCPASRVHLNLQRYLTGFTLIELLVTISIIAILMAITIPATTLARGLAKQAACRSNLCSIGWAFRMYLDDNDNKMPPATDLPSAQLDDKPPITKFLNIYLKNPRIFKCPADRGIKYPDQGKSYFEVEGSSYGYNTDLGGKPVSASRMATRRGEKEINIQVMYDYAPFHGRKIEYDPLNPPKFPPGWVNYLYADGHVGDRKKQD
jgi:prepilin-type N-terminal cleavage/methylation domain-containing protein/prepilin-type processing-associated H-X9-DG protein